MTGFHASYSASSRVSTNKQAAHNTIKTKQNWFSKVSKAIKSIFKNKNKSYFPYEIFLKQGPHSGITRKNTSYRKILSCTLWLLELSSQIGQTT